jgi:small-conductance mechanosensitive channel
MNFMPSHIQNWLPSLGWTALTVGVAYGLGHLINFIVTSRLVKLAARTAHRWDDIVIGELRRRIPFWSLLVGAWLSLGHWSLSPSAVLLVTRVLSALGTASVTLALASIGARLVASYGAHANPPFQVSRLTQDLVRILVVLLGTLVIIRGLGQDITPMLTALGVGGLAVALALQDPLSNLFAGLFVTIARQLQIGDYIKLDSGAEGFVSDFNWRSTQLRTLGGNIVLVPNAKLVLAVVQNLSVPAADFPVGVDLGADYASDLEAVERAALEVASHVLQTVPGGLPDFVPSVRFHTFGDYSVRFTVNLRVRSFADQFLVKHEYIKQLHARFAKDGIAIPIQTLALRDRI